jgi:NAD(P)H-hydrate epimerase
VLDADALNWLSTQKEWWARLSGARLVLTPHVGEFARLTGLEAAKITASPVEVAAEFARRIGQVVVLKGSPTVASDGQRALVAEDAPESLAKAGTGDVFSGTIGAFLAQGLAPLEAAGLAMHVGCRAARLVEERTGTLGLVASDLPMAIAESLKALERARESNRG